MRRIGPVLIALMLAVGLAPGVSLAHEADAGPSFEQTPATAENPDSTAASQNQNPLTPAEASGLTTPTDATYLTAPSSGTSTDASPINSVGLTSPADASSQATSAEDSAPSVSANASGLAAPADDASLLAQDAEPDLATVQDAVDRAQAYLTDHGMGASGFKGALEHEAPDMLCFSVEEGGYYLLRGDGHYAYDLSSGAVSAVPEAERVAVYETLAEARSAQVTDELFLTRGLAATGDGGHACYAKTTGALEHAAVSAAAPINSGDASAIFALDAQEGDSWRYRLVAADGAVDVRQFGYVIGGDARLPILAFGNTGFDTLLIPQGEHRLGGAVWTWRDGRSFYGFDATLYTDDTYQGDDRLNALWSVRGELIYGQTNVQKTVDGVTMVGLRLECRANVNAAGYRWGIFVRNANNVRIDRCAVIDPTESVVCIDFYGNYRNVELLNTSSSGRTGIEIRDLCDEGIGGRDVVVRGCTFESSAGEEGLPIFAGNDGNLVHPDGKPYAELKDCLVEDVLIEQNRFIMKEPSKKRVVAITCGYQDSPVRRVTIRDNDFDVWAETYLMLVGYAEDCEFSGNRVTLRSQEPGKLNCLVERSNHPRTGPTTDLCIFGNEIVCPDEGGKLTRVLDRELGEEVGDGERLLSSGVIFAGNHLSLAGSVERLLDSPATYRDNVFDLHDVKTLYSNVRMVEGNTYNIDTLDRLYEGNGVNAQADITITNERATIEEMPNNLMSFFGSGSALPTFNGHSMTYRDCRYGIHAAPNQYRRIASGPQLDQQLRVTFDNCYLPFFDDAAHFKVENNIDGAGNEKIVLAGTLATADFLPAPVHDWGEPSYVWADDGQTVTALLLCRYNAAHRECEVAEVRRTLTEPTCDKDGAEVLTATFANPAFENQEVREPIAALGHVDDGGVVTREPTVDAEGELTHRCTRCGAVLSTEPIPRKSADADEPIDGDDSSVDGDDEGGNGEGGGATDGSGTGDDDAGGGATDSGSTDDGTGDGSPDGSGAGGDGKTDGGNAGSRDANDGSSGGAPDGEGGGSVVDRDGSGSHDGSGSGPHGGDTDRGAAGPADGINATDGSGSRNATAGDGARSDGDAASPKDGGPHSDAASSKSEVSGTARNGAAPSGSARLLPATYDDSQVRALGLLLVSGLCLAVGAALLRVAGTRHRG